MCLTDQLDTVQMLIKVKSCIVFTLTAYCVIHIHESTGIQRGPAITDQYMGVKLKTVQPLCSLDATTDSIRPQSKT